MPRTIIAPNQPIGSYPATPLTADSADITMTGMDLANGNRILLNSRLLLIFDNTGADAVVTILSAPNAKNRKGDIAYTVPASTKAVFGPFPADGWRQADGYLYIDTASSSVFISGVVV